MGDFTGGELWIEQHQHEQTKASVPLPPELCNEHWDHSRRGRLIKGANRWIRFEPLRHHAVLPVRSGTRFSVTLFRPLGCHRLDQDSWRILQEHMHCHSLAQGNTQMARWRQNGQIMLASEPELSHELLIHGWCDSDLSDSVLSRKHTKALRKAADKLWNQSLRVHVDTTFLEDWPVQGSLRQELLTNACMQYHNPVESDEAAVLLCGKEPHLQRLLLKRQQEGLKTWWITCSNAESLPCLSTCTEETSTWHLFGSDLDTPIEISGAFSFSSWCKRVTQAIRADLQIEAAPLDDEMQQTWLHHSWPAEVSDSLDEEAEEITDFREEEENQEQENERAEDILSTAEKELVHKVHVNSGHPPRELLHRALAAAGCKPAVLRYIRRDYECPTCLSGARQQLRRKHCQVLTRATAQETAKAFRETWIRPHGIPEAILADGGPEFQQSFAEMCERLSILLLITDPESPWQAGRVERHGGWVKELAEAEINARHLHLADATELNMFLCELTAMKNSHFNRGGYTPMQLVYGRNPLVPGELLGHGETAHLAAATSYPQDNPAEQEYTRANQIRHRAREMAFSHQCRTKFNVAARAPLHKDQTFSPGQWVFVWRKIQAAQRNHMNHRAGSWRGPGLVVLQQGHTVYVSMRARLWRCNIDQVRGAGSAEMLGAELVQRGQLRDLLLHLHSTRGATAVDCTGDGRPSAQDLEAAAPLDEHASSIVPLGANNQVPPAISGEHAPFVPMPPLPEDRELADIPVPNAQHWHRETSTNTSPEPEPMDDVSSTHTRARAESDTQRTNPDGSSDSTKMARTASHQHASSAAAAAAASTAVAPAER
eukprot:6492759-Amphidinium_carterae.1